MTIHRIKTALMKWKRPAQRAMILGLAAALIMVLPAGVLPASQGEKSTSDTAPADIKISFILDSSLTRGMYMGERWVSPPTFAGVQKGKAFITEAKAECFDALGKPMDINPKWIPADPEMVEVSPGQARQVKITVRGPGQSRLKVVSQGFSRELVIKSTVDGDALRVEIFQK